MPAPRASTGPHSSISMPHLAWAAGHGTIVLATLYTLFQLVTFSSPVKAIYSLAYAGAIISWGVVVFKTQGVPTLDKAYINRFLTDENGEYLLLALYWFWSKPVYVSLLPFATFSLFHTLTFVRTTFLPPPTKAAAQGQPANSPNLSRQIQSWVKKNYEPAMLFVAYTEVVVLLPMLVFGVLLRRNSILAPLVFAHFLRLRYFLSPQTRSAFVFLNKQVESLIHHPSCPAPVAQGVTIARNFIVRYAEGVIAPSGANVQQQGPPSTNHSTGSTR